MKIIPADKEHVVVIRNRALMDKMATCRIQTLKKVLDKVQERKYKVRLAPELPGFESILMEANLDETFTMEREVEYYRYPCVLISDKEDIVIVKNHEDPLSEAQFSFLEYFERGDSYLSEKRKDWFEFQRYMRDLWELAIELEAEET